MFNTRLKQELSALREELSSLLQVRESLESEMLALTLDPEGRIASVNVNFLEEMVYQGTSLQGRLIDDLVPAHVKQDEFQLRFKNALTRGEHFAGTVRLLRGNGKEAWLRSIVQPVRGPEGRIKHFSIFSSDLTRTIEASREHENLIGALVRSTAVIEFDLNGNVLTANERFLNGMGYSLAQIQGKHHRLFCEPEEYNSAEYQNFWRRLNAGEFVADRFKRVDSHGRVVWLEASYNPVVDANERLYKVVKFATVITDQVNQEQAVAEAANIAYSTSLLTDSSAQRGTTVVTQAVDVMRDLAKHMQQAGEGIEALNAQSQVIGSIVKTISGIAEQTNLLALNAAIEAARAGEQGRGFAVVADEVRGLAQRTQQSTNEIQRMISTLQGGARDAVQAMSHSSEHVGASVEQAQRAAAALDGISQRVTQITAMSQQIAAAVEEQSAVSEDINRTIVGIRNAGEATVSAGQQSQCSSGDVAALAEDLRLLAQEFWGRRR